MSTPVSGFSKLSKAEKISWITQNYFKGDKKSTSLLQTYWNSDSKLQQLHDEFIENTISNYYLPLGVAPNFLINDRLYAIPMAIEESSVVAAASKAAKFWGSRGGFKTQVLNTKKVGQVHFTYNGDLNLIQDFFKEIIPILHEEALPITTNMKKRGGGILDIDLRDKTAQIPNYYQLHCTFNTLDAMGANFINSCLEQFAKTLEERFEGDSRFRAVPAGRQESELNIIMSILSNYVPECIVRAEVNCPIDQLTEKGIEGHEFAEKFVQAVRIAEIEPYRAVTHNKGFRAVEAGVHAYAARNGSYASLTGAKVEDDIFSFWIELPLALGTVGGLTKLHPLVKWSLELLQNPSAQELMQIVAVAATTGIQQGHMKMHLMNILNQMEATPDEKKQAITHFKETPVTHSGAVSFIENLRS